MKPLDREPSNGATAAVPGRLCDSWKPSTSGTLGIAGSSRDEIESDLGGRVYCIEWPSHLTAAVGACSNEAQQVLTTLRQSTALAPHRRQSGTLLCSCLQSVRPGTPST